MLYSVMPYETNKQTQPRAAVEEREGVGREQVSQPVL